MHHSSYTSWPQEKESSSKAGKLELESMQVKGTRCIQAFASERPV